MYQEKCKTSQVNCYFVELYIPPDKSRRSWRMLELWSGKYKGSQNFVYCDASAPCRTSLQSFGFSWWSWFVACSGILSIPIVIISVISWIMSLRSKRWEQQFSLKILKNFNKNWRVANRNSAYPNQSTSIWMNIVNLEMHRVEQQPFLAML